MPRGEDRTDIEFLQVLAETDELFLSSREIADKLSYDTTRAVNERLRDLPKDDLVESKRVGNGFAWWITDDGREYLRQQES